MILRYIFIFSLGLAYFITPLIIRLARKTNVLDHPDPRKVHARPMPLLGGVVIYIAFLLPLLPLISTSHYLQGVIIAASLIFITGLIDDIRKLSAFTRLIVQIAAALILIKYGIQVSFLPQGPVGDAIECFLTIVWVVGITNAMNCLDGIDGLLSSIGIVTGACFFALAYQTNQLWLGCVAIALVGSLLGFLRYNFSPAKIFLGDAGSTLIGFLLSSIALLGNWAQDSKVSLLVPVLILGVPIFDMCFTTVMRIREGLVKNVAQWLHYAGKDHFHHRLLDLGLGPRGATILISSVSFCLGISALALRKTDLQIAFLLLAQAAIVFIIIAILMVAGTMARKEKAKL
jgi:UDP-GlcNAc:undecaprenyl-phosphate GlcNAc-1-phosphate transferase